jgi:hypothetical protein
VNDAPNLTPDERKVIELLAKAWDAYVAMKDKHPCDNAEFCQAIHVCQNLIAYRVARRVDPGDWYAVGIAPPPPPPPRPVRG